MAEQGLDGFIVPKADEYQGEFVAPYAERLKWLTGFTGSAGVAIVLQNKACVLTDGRYRIQITGQIDNDIFAAGDSIKTGLHGWLLTHAEKGSKIGYDPWLHTPNQVQKLKEECPEIELIPVKHNLIDEIWLNQPEKPRGRVEIFPQSLAGASLKEKKARVAENIKAAGAQAAMITLPDSIAWLLNVRGSDIEYIPSVLSYAVVFADEAEPVWWIVDQAKVGADVRAYGDGAFKLATLEDLQSIKASPIMFDCAHSPEYFHTQLLAQGQEIIDKKDPCIDLKALKTDAEVEAIKKAHIIDALALTKFLHWLDKTVQRKEITETDVADQLQKFRAENSAYKGPSFATISGFGSNGAIVHYRADDQTNKTLEEGSLLLVDSGGQYCENDAAGTTDITRTIVIGQPSDEMRRNFTLVLKGHIALAMAKFPAGTTGAQIDTLARQPLWNEGLDYAHGTGHGVGCYLAVHEEAASISPKGTESFKSGMLISNEPGYYKDGAYGIRIENLVLVKEAGQCADTGGQMLRFETVSFVPIDRRLIDVKMLNVQERDWLNDYHAKLYEHLHEGLSNEVSDWLHTATLPV